LLIVTVGGGDGPPRVGVVAGRRVGKAVVRNKVKRRLREALARADLRRGTTYVVVALPEAATASFGELAAWVRLAVRGASEKEKESE
jgi:ribonuclease P protein component